MPVRQIINLVNFAIKNNMPGNPLTDSKTIILDAVNQCLAPHAHADSIEAYGSHTGPVYELMVRTQYLPKDSYIKLFFELDPDEQKWMTLARFNPKTELSSIHEFLQGKKITGTDTINHMVRNVAHLACIDKVKKSLQFGRKVTLNTDAMEPMGHWLHGNISYENVTVELNRFVMDPDNGDIMADHGDELTVIGISEHGDVTFIESNRQIPFTLNAEETVAMLQL